MKTIGTLLAHAGKSTYNDLAKKEFARQGKAFMREIAKELAIPKGRFDIRFNPGGVAVSGDVILHSDCFYICVTSFGAYWRHCKGQKDYTGEYNRHVSPAWTPKEFARIIQKSFDGPAMF